MPMLVLDRYMADEYIQQRRESGNDRWDEVWDGVYMLMPNPNIEHQEIATTLSAILWPLINRSGLGKIYQGINVSDRLEFWTKNYRCPDVAVYLAGNPAQPKGAYWLGGPDFAVEIVSPDDRSRDKLGFYSSVGVRELLLIDREPWSLELFRNEGKGLLSAGRSTLEDPGRLTSTVLPVTFRLVPGEPRPAIEVSRTDETGMWSV